MAEEQRPLPEFDAPPVSEVVLAVEFAPLAAWRVPHFGLFWDSIRSEYPHCDVQPPIMSKVEQFPPEAVRLDLIPIITDLGAIRCWFLDTPQTGLVQVQADRFIRNWRQVVGNEPYPRYDHYLRPAFERDWGRFRDFLAINNLGVPQVVQCEVMYINDIDRGVGWQEFAELAKVTPLWSGKVTDGFLPGPESVGVSLAYTMPENTGRLRINIQHAVRLRDGKEILQLRLVARGKPESSEMTDILAWMDRGRDWIVRAFADVTSPEMHTIWKRRI